MKPRLAARWLRLFMLDALDIVGRRRRPMSPPRRAIEEIGGFDFAAIGRHLMEIAISAGLRPDDRIIDPGCGYGRLAVPLTGYLSPAAPLGSYDGFDVSRRAIRWCIREIAARHPNFHFQHADVRNRHYNRRGSIPAETFRFPCETGSADMVFAASLFTHLTREAFVRYIEEAARVLRPGGRLVASFFLLNEESRERIAAGRGEPKFRLAGDIAVQDENDPEAAIAFSETFVRDTLSKTGMPVIATHYGSWCERAQTLSYQDFIVAEKTLPFV